MEVEDVIELGSSDEEPDLPPPKKIKTVTNAMVHIPTKIHGVTIKPVKTNTVNTSKLFSGKNITVTKIPKAAASVHTGKVIPMKVSNTLQRQPPVPKLVKKKVFRKPTAVQNKGTVFNPMSHMKSIGNSVITRINKPIPIVKPQTLPILPPSVTVKKTGGPVKIPISMSTMKKNAPVVAPKNIRKRKLKTVATVELDIEESTAPSETPQWYMRPEEQTEKTDLEKINNKEPETPSYIEITIEDSPIKPVPPKRARELSTENIITIHDSPNKTGAVTEVAEGDEGSNDEPKTKKKAPQSKKKLDYNNLEKIEESCTLEIEIDPIAVDESTLVKKDNKMVTLTPDIIEVEKSSVEIALNQQGDVSVVQMTPTVQPKEDPVPTDTNNGIAQKDFHPTYLSFIDLCLKVENSDDMRKIIEKKIKPYYTQVPKEYTQSEYFIDMVSSKVSAIKAAPEKMYLYIKDIVDELNLQRKLAKHTPVPEIKPKSFEVEKDSEIEPSKQRQIRKLEKTLKKLNRAIQKLEMQEVDFEDEEDSVYLLTEKYKERMVRVHAKFCQLTNSKMPSEPRLVIDHRQGKAPGPAKRLEAYINKKNSLVFPDFHDVLRCVREANEEDKLGWTEAVIMEEARDLFVRCGRQLQRRRQEKEWRLATSRITLNEDPAEHSEELKKRLDSNRHLAKTNETEIIDKFSDKQNLLKLEAEEINDNEAEESPVESEEEENDQSYLLESKQRRKDRIRRLLQEQSQKQSANNSKNTEERNTYKGTDSDVEAVDGKDNLQEKPVIEDENIQLLSDDSNEVGSDVDELHLLQKLRSDDEIRSISTADSTDSDSPVEISDTLNSSSDEGNKEKENNVISIENSSYSDESDTQENVENANKKHTVANSELVDEGSEMECASEEIVKNTHFTDDPFDNVLLTSSDAESGDTASVPNNSKKTEKMENATNVVSKEKTAAEPEEVVFDNPEGGKSLQPDGSSSSNSINVVISSKNDSRHVLEIEQKTSDSSDKSENNTICIENVTCSNESDSQDNVEETNKEHTVANSELVKEKKDIEFSSANIVKKCNSPDIETESKTSDNSNTTAAVKKTFNTNSLHSDNLSTSDISITTPKQSENSQGLSEPSKGARRCINSAKEDDTQSADQICMSSSNSEETCLVTKENSHAAFSETLLESKDGSPSSSCESLRAKTDSYEISTVEPKIIHKNVQKTDISDDGIDCTEASVACNSKQAIEVEGEIVITNILSSKISNQTEEIPRTNLNAKHNSKNDIDVANEINGNSNCDGDIPNPVQSDINLVENIDNTETDVDTDEKGICAFY